LRNAMSKRWNRRACIWIHQSLQPADARASAN